MVSLNRLEEILVRIRQLSGCELSLWDSLCNRLYATDGSFEGLDTSVRNFITSNATAQEIAQVQYAKVMEEGRLIYVLLVSGADAPLTARLTVNQLENLSEAFREKIDKDSFIRDLLLDNLLLVDIRTGAAKLALDNEQLRCVYVVDGAARQDIPMIEDAVKDRGKSVICVVEEGSLTCIKDITDPSDEGELEEYASCIRKAFAREQREIRIGYGTVAHDLKDISHSYKEAHMAVKVGKIFFEDNRVMSYSSLGIGRLIYQLPVPLCKMFISEIFEGITPDEFDEETLTTISRFFENSLNVSETSRQLFIHRNTLVYRLDKIQKVTGLDLRVFDDAITFKIALLVVKYMKYVEEEAF